MWLKVIVKMNKYIWKKISRVLKKKAFLCTNKIHLFMCCSHHLYSLQMKSMWATDIITLLFNISFYSQKKGSHISLNSGHLHHIMASFRAPVFLVCCRRDWTRHRGAAHTVTCPFPGFQLQILIEFLTLTVLSEAVYYTTWRDVIRHPSCSSHSWSQTRAAAAPFAPRTPPPPTPQLQDWGLDGSRLAVAC